MNFSSPPRRCTRQGLRGDRRKSLGESVRWSPVAALTDQHSLGSTAHGDELTVL